MRELHIQLTLSFPGDPLAVRRKLIDAIEAELGIEVGDTGAGGGVMDIWLTAKKPKATTRGIRQIARRLGIAEWTTVTIREQTVQVEILCDDDYPEADAIAAGRALMDEIDRDPKRWGEATSMGVVGGIIAIQIEVRDPAVATARLDAITKRLGIADRVRIDER